MNDISISNLNWDAIKARKARDSLLDFTTYTFKAYETNWHHELICDYLERWYSGEIKRLMVFSPPRSGKSELVSRRLPAWIFGKDPDCAIIATSYGMDLASKMNRDVQRIITSDEYHRVFPETSLSGRAVRTITAGESYLRNTENFEIVGHKGIYKCAGVGGGITGMGGNCLSGDTLIMTTDGQISIETLIYIEHKPKVLSYNHDSEQLEWKDIVAWRCNNSRDIVSIQTVRGDEIRATSGHRFFTVQHGYKEANCLRRGDTIIRLQHPWKMYSLWNKYFTKRTSSLSTMLLQNQACNNNFKMFNVRNRIRAKIGRFSKNETTYIRKRQSFLRFMRERRNIYSRNWKIEIYKKKPIGCSSYRRKSSKQYSRKFGYAVQKVSQSKSKTTYDEIDMVRKLCTTEIPVYDIQVEGNSNFFANQILSHNCLIIDDPVKDRKQAESKAYQDSVMDWFSSTLYTRRMDDNARILITQTRWSQQDLSGKLLDLAKTDPHADQWTVLSLPMIAEDPLSPEDPRQVGEPLWPERFSMESLLATRSVMGQYDWAALMQQNPVASGGTIFNRGWWKFYDDDPQILQYNMQEILQSWDMTFAGGDKSDFVVGQVWGRKGADKYLLDQVRFQGDFNRTMNEFRLLNAKWPKATRKLVEKKANGDAIISSLQHEIAGIIPVMPLGGKMVRAQAVAPEVESGNVYLPGPKYAPWIHDFLDEISAFPNGKKDDIVDSFSQSLANMTIRGIIVPPTMPTTPICVGSGVEKLFGDKRNNKRRLSAPSKF